MSRWGYRPLRFREVLVGCVIVFLLTWAFCCGLEGSARARVVRLRAHGQRCHQVAARQCPELLREARSR